MPSPAEKKSTHRKIDSSRAKPRTDKHIKHDWSAIRREHIRGEDTVTLSSLGRVTTRH